MGFCLTPRSVRDSQHRPVDDGRSVWFFEQDRSSDGTLAKDLDQAEYDAELIRQGRKARAEMMRRMDRVLERMQDLDNRTKHLEPRILLGSPSTEAADSSPSSEDSFTGSCSPAISISFQDLIGLQS